MDISLFYELRTRLYLTAAAGCAAIGEDFRLKRAVEAFEPLSKVNKPFMGLYKKCAALFDSADTASDLADCIALADALAVAQGTFGENTADTEDFPETGAAYIDAPSSVITEMTERMRKTKYNGFRVNAEDVPLLSDPRIISEFVKCSAMGGDSIEILAGEMFKKCGRGLVPLIKNSLDLSDEKATGMQVRLVEKFVGEEENYWYLSLAQNENAPKNVRIKAIEALGCSPDNTEKLIELFNTEKGKFKTAALNALARLSPEQAEPIFKKLAAKYKSSYEEAFTLSKGKACTDFALKSDFFKQEHFRISMLKNKPGAEEFFAHMAETEGEYNNTASQINRLLVSNIVDNEEQEYRDMILRLYQRYPDIFAFARFYLELMQDPENAADTMADAFKKHVKELRMAIWYIRYDHITQMYRLGWVENYGHPDYSRKSFPLFKTFPDNLLKLITPEFEYIRKKGDKDKPPNSSLLSKINALLPMATAVYGACSPEDKDRIKAEVLRFAMFSARNCPTSQALWFIADNYKTGSEEEYYGITSDYIISELLTNEKSMYYYFGSNIDRFPMSDKAKIAELTSLVERLEKLKGRVSERYLKTQSESAKKHIASLKERNE